MKTEPCHTPSKHIFHSEEKKRERRTEGDPTQSPPLLSSILLPILHHRPSSRPLCNHSSPAEFSPVSSIDAVLSVSFLHFIHLCFPSFFVTPLQIDLHASKTIFIFFPISSISPYQPYKIPTTPSSSTSEFPSHIFTTTPTTHSAP
ncbi:hypothetical protein NE237_031970 [Protea cynaroides]|uniref:Uncharacterized protein n=1 Tax=Protea cynaroides TaxID=273540 RepID=A0A9Q0R2N2_9MAGN|nr:hypothetical protein NE237_031970 [Protea cynaroides]